MSRPRKAPGELGAVNFYGTASGVRAQTSIRTLEGKLVRISARGATEGEARASLEARANNVWNGLFIRIDPGTTVGDLAKHWAEELVTSQRIEQSTKEGYLGIYKNGIAPQLKDIELKRLSVAVCDRFLKKLLETRTTSYVGQVRRVLHQLLRLAVRYGAIPTNYVRECDPLPQTPPRYIQFDSDQVVRILELYGQWRDAYKSGPAHRDGELIPDVIMLILATSMRPGEVLSLRRQDLVVNRGRVWICVAGTISTTVKYGTIRKPHPRFARQERRIAVPRFAEEILRRRVADYIDNGLIAFEGVGGV